MKIHIANRKLIELLMLYVRMDVTCYSIDVMRTPWNYLSCFYFSSLLDFLWQVFHSIVWKIPDARRSEQASWVTDLYTWQRVTKSKCALSEDEEILMYRSKECVMRYEIVIYNLRQNWIGLSTHVSFNFFCLDSLVLYMKIIPLMYMQFPVLLTTERHDINLSSDVHLLIWGRAYESCD